MAPSGIDRFGTAQVNQSRGSSCGGRSRDHQGAAGSEGTVRLEPACSVYWRWSLASGLPSPHFRVPKLCPAPAFLAVFAVVAECRMSKLQILRMAWGFKSPSPHQILVELMSASQNGVQLQTKTIAFLLASVWR